jgi:hypothetical protein
MSHFWASFFQHLSDCGRQGTLFVAVLLAFFAALIGGGILNATPVPEYALDALPFLILLSLFCVLWTLRQKKRRAQVSQPSPVLPPLSRDEVRAARSKLTRQQDRPGIWARL